MEDSALLREALEGVRQIQEDINESLQHVLEKLSTVDVDSQKVFQKEVHSLLDDINATELSVEHRLLALERGHNVEQQDSTMAIIASMFVWGLIVYYLTTSACGV
jgi:hypothetical protein